MIIKFIIGIGMGAIIGAFTNSVAIKMMFRPFYPVYLDKKNKKYQLPFTPGLIPKEKSRLATAIGRIVGNKLLDSDTLKKALLSDSIHDKVIEKVSDFVNQYATMDCTIEQFLQDKNYLEKVDSKEILIKEKLGNHVTKKLLEANIGKIIVEFAMEELSKKLNQMFMNMITKTINIEHLEEKVNKIAEEKVPNIISGYIDKEYQNIKDKPISEIVNLLINLYPNYAEKIWDFYKKIVEDKATDILKEFNISKIVEEKINEFELEELEKMVIEIADKELKALVGFGGILGAVMGIFTTLLNMI